VRVLVTGASGFVGGALLRRAQAAGRASHWLGIGRRPLSDPGFGYLQHDLAEPLPEFGAPFDAVVHCAARATPWGTTAQYRRDNIEATRQLIDWCERHGRPRLLYVSSSSVFYRSGDQFDLTEDSPIGPAFVNHYAASKHAGEQLVRQYRGASLTLRPRAVFGPGDTVLFPRILAAARRGKLPLLVRGDGRPAIGDLVYIDTLSDGLLGALDRPHLAGAINLTNAEPVALEGLLLQVLSGLGLPTPRRRVRVGVAMAGAALLETAWRALPCVLTGEPPITRFGVGVLAWSKTFDVRRQLTALGPPSVSIAEGVQRFITWQLAQLERGP
jgi:2-alkyl-3-oxoalkanoate reductase